MKFKLATPNPAQQSPSLLRTMNSLQAFTLSPALKQAGERREGTFPDLSEQYAGT